jgi:hypothetical protein
MHSTSVLHVPKKEPKACMMYFGYIPEIFCTFNESLFILREHESSNVGICAICVPKYNFYLLLIVVVF